MICFPSPHQSPETLRPSAGSNTCSRPVLRSTARSFAAKRATWNVSSAGQGFGTNCDAVATLPCAMAHRWWSSATLSQWTASDLARQTFAKVWAKPLKALRHVLPRTWREFCKTLFATPTATTRSPICQRHGKQVAQRLWQNQLFPAVRTAPAKCLSRHQPGSPSSAPVSNHVLAVVISIMANRKSCTSLQTSSKAPRPCLAN